MNDRYTTGAISELVYNIWLWFGQMFVSPKFLSARCPYCKKK